MLNRQYILGVAITSEKKEKILEYVLAGCYARKEKLMIVTPNPEIIMMARSQPEFKKLLNEAKVGLHDGVGLTIAAHVLGIPLQERITGVDFMEELCKVCREKPLSMGFLGGRGRVAELAAECLQKKYPWIRVSYAGPEWIDSFKNKPADILFVAYGAPKQETWIAKHLPSSNVTAAMGVGGAFDYYSRKVPRAPYLIRSVGLEWLFRLCVQPWRIKRQFALLKFLVLVYKEKFSLT